MRVLHVSSELAPFAHSGGLGDVVAGLPAAQAELGLEPAVLVPLYRGVAARAAAAGCVLEAAPLVFQVGPHRVEAALRIARIGRVRCGFLDVPALYDRAGDLYGPGGGGEFGDNHLRFGALGAAALAAGRLLLGGVDVLHAHDWQGSAAAIYAHLARAGGDPDAAALSIVTTIHNLAFRGIFGKHAMTDLGLPWSLFTAPQLEFYDQVSLLKGALALSDAVTTVSPTYAQEILTPERGEDLDGFLRWDVRRIAGIVNGIDTTAWNPATDPALPARYSPSQLAGKRACRAALAAEAGLAMPGDGAADDAAPLIGVISRMSGQKGLDLLAEVAPALGELGAKLVVLGTGEPWLEARFADLARAHPAHVAVRIGFDIAYARRIYGGCDLFAMPSRFEPCGLGQLYAMRYGAVPIVHAVGGLRDTVIGVDERGRDAGAARGTPTGIRFDEATPRALRAAIERAVALYRDRDAFARVQRGALARDSSWTVPAHEYVQLYRSVRP